MPRRITLTELKKIIKGVVKEAMGVDEDDLRMRTGKCRKCGKIVQVAKGVTTYHDYVNPLGEIQNCPGSVTSPFAI